MNGILESESAKHGVMIRDDNQSIEVFNSAFPRKVNDILSRNGHQWRVIYVTNNKAYAGGMIATFGNTLFLHHKF